MNDDDDTTPDRLPRDPARRKAALAAQFDEVKAQIAALTPSQPKPLPPGVARDIISAIPSANKGDAYRVLVTRPARFCR